MAAPDARYTLVAFHAHPDDEALFTGGLLARCAAEGHRVVVVTATAGELGLSGGLPGGLPGDLGRVRMRELQAATDALGVSRLVTLGYADSGMDESQPPPAGSLCAAAVGDVAARVAKVLQEERADVLTVYDPHGGYGHRDHRRVHDAGVAAAALAATPVVLEATVAREPLQRALRLLNAVGVRPGGMTPDALATAFRSRHDMTHRVDVRPWVGRKRAALAAHASQATGGADVRTVALLTRLPGPVLRRVLGWEWYVEIGRPPPQHPLGDVFATLR